MKPLIKLFLCAAALLLTPNLSQQAHAQSHSDVMTEKVLDSIDHAVRSSYIHLTLAGRKYVFFDFDKNGGAIARTENIVLSDAEVTTVYNDALDILIKINPDYLPHLQGSLRLWIRHLLLSSLGNTSLQLGKLEVRPPLEKLLDKIILNQEGFSQDLLSEAVQLSDLFNTNINIEANKKQIRQKRSLHDAKMQFAETEIRIKLSKNNIFELMSQPYKSEPLALVNAGLTHVPFQLLNQILYSKSMPMEYQLRTLADTVAVFSNFTEFESYIYFWLRNNATVTKLSEKTKPLLFNLYRELAKHSQKLSTPFLLYLEGEVRNNSLRNFPRQSHRTAFYLELKERGVKSTCKKILK